MPYLNYGEKKHIKLNEVQYKKYNLKWYSIIIMLSDWDKTKNKNIFKVIF